MSDKIGCVQHDCAECQQRKQNPCAATRLAIVHAAVAIEDSKPEAKSAVFCTGEVLHKLKDVLE